MAKNGYGQYLLRLLDEPLDGALMQVTPTSHCPDVLLIEPQRVRRRARVLLRELEPARVRRRPASTPSSCRTTTRARAAACCAACTTRSSMRRASWCASIDGEVFDVAVDLRRRRRRSGARSAIALSARESADAVDSARLRARLPRRVRRARNSSTRRPTTGIRSTSARCCGTIPRSASRGRAGVEPALAAKDAAGVPLAAADCLRLSDRA